MAVKPDPTGRPERTLTHISTSASTAESHASLDMNMPDEPTRRGSWLLGPIYSAPMPLSAPATPPPEFEHEPDNQTMSGIGCLFPQRLPSRPSSLTVGSESNTDVPSTPSHVSDANDDIDLEEAQPPSEDVLETPRAVTSFQAPILKAPNNGIIFGQMSPLTPDPTPVRKMLKRSPSPPSAPRPKRARLAAVVDSEDEGYSEAQSEEPGTGQSLQQIQQLTIDLADFTSVVVSPRDNAAYESETNTQAELQLESQRSNTAMLEHYSATKALFLDIEWFSEDEIVEQLSVLLGAYRAFYLEPDEAEEPRTRDPEAARNAQQTFEAIFENQLSSAEDREFLLQEEEEDVLNVFAIWVWEMKVSSDACREGFEDVFNCLRRVTDLSASPFIRRLVLSGEPIDIGLVVNDFSIPATPAYTDEGQIEWEFEMFFGEFERLSIG